MTLLDEWGKRRRKPCSWHWISFIVWIPSVGWNYQTGGRIGDFVAIYNVLGLTKSVCCCIPMFPYKCGRHLKENHKSVVKRLLPMAGSVKKFGTSRNRARPATLWQQEPWAWSQGLGSKPWACHLQAGYRQGKLPKFPHLWNGNNNGASWLVGWVKWDSLVHLLSNYSLNTYRHYVRCRRYSCKQNGQCLMEFIF